MLSGPAWEYKHVLEALCDAYCQKTAPKTYTVEYTGLTESPSNPLPGPSRPSKTPPSAKSGISWCLLDAKST